MSTILWLIATLLAVATIPLIVLGWLTESDRQRARRLRREGWSQRRIADYLEVTPYRVRKLLAA
jgi:hypothetical protein